MERIEAIEKAAGTIANLKPGDRTAEVNRLLAGRLTLEQLKQPWGKELLHRRALLMTLLAEQQLWPK